MVDEALREQLRRLAKSPTPALESEYLAAALRSGALERSDVELAASLGSRGAQAVLNLHSKDLDRDSRAFFHTLTGLERWGARPLVVAGLACAEACLPEVAPVPGALDAVECAKEWLASPGTASLSSRARDAEHGVEYAQASSDAARGAAAAAAYLAGMVPPAVAGDWDLVLRLTCEVVAEAAKALGSSRAITLAQRAMLRDAIGTDHGWYPPQPGADASQTRAPRSLPIDRWQTRFRSRPPESVPELALQIARHVLPVWQDHYPDDPRPQQLLELLSGASAPSEADLHAAVLACRDAAEDAQFDYDEGDVETEAPSHAAHAIRSAGDVHRQPRDLDGAARLAAHCALSARSVSERVQAWLEELVPPREID